MWQSGGMGAHAANNPWMKLMGIVHKERRHHDSGGGASGGQGTTAASANERGLTQNNQNLDFIQAEKRLDLIITPQVTNVLIQIYKCLSLNLRFSRCGNYYLDNTLNQY
ncbi:hypothetical protein PV327_004171 [Microctonus hyperodae]|uniref:Uncharacterized protein n=1 Tax=Microctonus hyperodae TaxID=165561 RepID=A0AA39FBU2_MICHY|nr:hypothetical protein PV327_004171 [Microctonus hyperodae]